MPSKRMALLIAGMMVAASIGAIVAKPTRKAADVGLVVRLDAMIPRRFGEWREETLGYVRVVNPQTKQLLDKLYSQVLTRVYASAEGYRIMLSVAYGKDQRGSLQAHKPEVCYPAQGFVVKRNRAGRLVTEFGTIPVRRLFAVMGARREPVTYWFTIGDEAVRGKLQKRLAELRYGLTGLIPDGVLFRVSSIDPDPEHAYRLQDRFVGQLLEAVSPAARKRLSGLGNG